jgi:aryl-alcohol dehydrogenase-like predicted oxidoreductase
MALRDSRITTTLGRTGLEVSVAGLGCGGHSRLGLAQGRSEEEAADLVRRAVDLGITFIDTARVYGTERAVGLGVRGRRDEVTISSKAFPVDRDGRIFAAHVEKQIDASLAALGTDRIDVLHLHGVLPEHYTRALEEYLPVLERARQAGKVRFLAISEVFVRDPGHAMLPRALADDHFDVVMVGFNLLNPSARQRVLQPALERDVGTLVMFAVRRALSRPEELARVCADLQARGVLAEGALDAGDPLGFLRGDGRARSVVEAAYRFCRHEPGVHVVLTGTGSAEHLVANVEAIEAGPLPAQDRARLEALFGEVDFLSAN